MGQFLGIILHAVGGLAAGSFYIPFRRVKDWAWETYWLTQGFAAWIVMPVVIAWLTTPNLPAIISASPVKSMWWAYIFGVMWGIGGLTFGLSMRYLGMSLGYAMALGFCAAFGTMIPPVVAGDAVGMFTTASGFAVFAGVVVCLLCIALCGYAGVLKERELTEEQKRRAIKEFALIKGFMVAVFAGIMSACMAFAIQAGKPIAQAALDAGAKQIYQNNPVFIFAMGGGFTTNCIWCLILTLKNKSASDYVKNPSKTLLTNYVLAFVGGTTWYLQFFFYGMGLSKLGRNYDFASWTIHMAFIIVFSSMWGLLFKEWKGSSRRTYSLIFFGLFVLLTSTIVKGYGNYIASR
ncbi:MAG: rhamnose/proton symporter RhaT [Candidatus Brocadiia bacterium]|nr:MAG: rhamnose/proton symporter RhaT [Candidatus Brocadiia bacterium]